MELRFWGVRGSIPAPGHHTLRVGGNTTCVSVHSGDTLLVFDAGTGIRRLGQHLEAVPQWHWRGCLFFTHYHWDHIQGLPFFAPARRVDNRFRLFGENKEGVDVETLLHLQMQEPYFPVDQDELKGLVDFQSIGPMQVLEPCTGFTIRTARLNHPGDALGYRLDSTDGSVCIVTDHEHPQDGIDEGVVEFARRATVLVHEAQYTPTEKAGPRAGWGHSSWRDAARTALAAEVGVLFLSHHDPERSDDEVFEIRERARAVFPRTEVATEASRLDVRSIGQAAARRPDDA